MRQLILHTPDIIYTQDILLKWKSHLNMNLLFIHYSTTSYWKKILSSIQYQPEYMKTITNTKIDLYTFQPKYITRFSILYLMKIEKMYLPLTGVLVQFLDRQLEFVWVSNGSGLALRLFVPQQGGHLAQGIHASFGGPPFLPSHAAHRSLLQSKLGLNDLQYIRILTW